MKLQLDLGHKGAYLELVGSPKHHQCYIWIGSDDGCFGVVKDADIQRLRDFCNVILGDTADDCAETQT